MAESDGKSRRLYLLIKYWWPSKDTSNWIILPDGPLSKIQLQSCIKLSLSSNSRWVFLLRDYVALGGNTIKNMKPEVLNTYIKHLTGRYPRVRVLLLLIRLLRVTARREEILKIQLQMKASPSPSSRNNIIIVDLTSANQ